MQNSEEIQLYRAIESAVEGPRIKSQLNSFGVAPEDAVQDIWIELIDFARTGQVRNVTAYARYWVRRMVNPIINREIKHRRNRDRREVV